MSICCRTRGNGIGLAIATVDVTGVSAEIVRRGCSGRRLSRTLLYRRHCRRPLIHTRSTGSVRQARRAPPAPGPPHARSLSPPRAARWRAARGRR